MPSSHFPLGSPAWMAHGACQGEDPVLFFPIATSGPALAQVFAAKAACLRWAIRVGCLSYALVTGQAGIWGGTTRDERLAMRRLATTGEHAARTDSRDSAAHHHGSLGGQ